MERRVDAPRHSLCLHPCLDASDLPDEVVGDSARRIPELVRQGGEPRAQLAVAGDRLGPQQRLGFPGNRPALVVGAVGGQGAYERALLALGPQPRVDQERRVGRGAGQQRPHVLGDRVRGLAGFLLIGTGHRVMHEHHVGIAAVAGLVTTEATHRHDAQPGG